MRVLAIVLTFLVSLAMAFSAEMSKAELRGRSLSAAKLLAQRSMIETIYGQDLQYFSQISQLDAATFTNSLQTKTGGHIRGIQFAEAYDEKRDIAVVTAELNVDKITDLAPGWKNVAGSKIVRRTAFASATPQSNRMLRTLRAAELDAYRHLFEQLCGFELESKTTLKTMVLTNDKVASRLMGKVMGAKMITEATDKDRIEWSDNSADASATVTLEANIRDIEAAIGQKFIGCKADIIRVKGIGLASAHTKVEKPVIVEKKVVVEKKVIVTQPVIIESQPKVEKINSTVLPR